MTRFLSSVDGDNIPGPKSYAPTISAAILSLHCSVILSDRSISTVSLSICAVVFLASGLLFCEKLPSMGQNIPEVVVSHCVDIECCQRRTCLDRLRTVAFLLTVGLTLSLFALYRVDKAPPIELWRNEIKIAVIKCGQWFLICFLVWLLVLDI
jgi:hypothetical protein